MRIRSVGAHALLLDVDDPPTWFAHLWRRREAGELTATEIVPAANTVLLDGVADLAATSELLRRWASRKDDSEEPGSPQELGRLVTIPVVFHGPDLETVAQHWNTTERGVIDQLTGTELRVGFCGFAPGWAYLTGLPEHLAVPRLATPRTKVPAGSVALADGYAGIYPTATPGGWQIIGHTEVRLFDPDLDPPALLTPGTRVSFTEVGLTEVGLTQVGPTEVGPTEVDA